MKALAWVIITCYVVASAIGAWRAVANALKRYSSGAFAAYTWVYMLVTVAEVWAFFYLWQLR